jgi:hypothetical protein
MLFLPKLDQFRLLPSPKTFEEVDPRVTTPADSRHLLHIFRCLFPVVNNDRARVAAYAAAAVARQYFIAVSGKIRAITPGPPVTSEAQSCLLHRGQTAAAKSIEER